MMRLPKKYLQVCEAVLEHIQNGTYSTGDSCLKSKLLWGNMGLAGRPFAKRFLNSN